MSLKMSLDELRVFMDDQFPQVKGEFEILDVAPLHITVRKLVEDKHLRPGGTVSGPTMFMLADVCMYLAILAMIGPKALAVTTNCSIDFMRKPVAHANLRAEARIHKLGRVLAVGDVLIYSEGEEAPVARASLTYSIPPERD
ncbi:PaaI family thioesterase [Aliiroseovarius subalbicans]|uniref:PaaI family thioesterase n=1 Tax=Aliiroseovarius subalbicans TaxID=2925840 RepID=UPI001F579578|nr:PaaI family thioesterase [Aliiroseovarius subalbicans]MCI2398250.1 PaaI family thioesterase [Aliiroseovarius subalbicans]